MADPEFIELLANECRGAVSKRLTDEEVRAWASLIHRTFQFEKLEVLSKAVDLWLEAQTDNNPAFKLPALQTIRTNVATVKRAEAETTSSGEQVLFAPPRREFVAAHQKYQRTVERMAKAFPDHNHKRGPESCPICGPGGDDRRELLAGLRAELPLPRDGSPRPCRCDGSGWIPEDGGRASFPCKDCNGFYWEWAGVPNPTKGRK